MIEISEQINGENEKHPKEELDDAEKISEIKKNSEPINKEEKLIEKKEFKPSHIIILITLIILFVIIMLIKMLVSF